MREGERPPPVCERESVLGTETDVSATPTATPRPAMSRSCGGGGGGAGGGREDVDMPAEEAEQHVAPALGESGIGGRFDKVLKVEQVLPVGELEGEVGGGDDGQHVRARGRHQVGRFQVPRLDDRIDVVRCRDQQSKLLLDGRFLAVSTGEVEQALEHLVGAHTPDLVAHKWIALVPRQHRRPVHQEQVQYSRHLGSQLGDGRLSARLPHGLPRHVRQHAQRHHDELLPVEGHLLSRAKVLVIAQQPVHDGERNVVQIHLEGKLHVGGEEGEEDADEDGDRRLAFLVPNRESPLVGFTVAGEDFVGALLGDAEGGQQVLVLHQRQDREQHKLRVIYGVLLRVVEEEGEEGDGGGEGRGERVKRVGCSLSLVGGGGVGGGVSAACACLREGEEVGAGVVDSEVVECQACPRYVA
mmetsp:Transcript_7071/g.14076  ORF Transcript_7071/g.14076 Transcript_7071/m.14076 type:complete len:413 (-) Transcript_7071:994-2232(-)